MDHRESISVRHRTNTETNRMQQKAKWPHSTTTTDYVNVPQKP